MTDAPQERVQAARTTDWFYAANGFSGSACQLTDDEARHVCRVLRRNVGDAITVFDGAGTVGLGTITSLSHRDVQIALTETWTQEYVAVDVELATAAPKGDRLKWLVEKAVELGVRRLSLLRTERSVVHPGTTKVDRLKATVIAACKQSRRAHLMSVTGPISLPDWTTSHGPLDDVLLAHPNADLSLGDAVASERNRQEATLLIGPEGGFADGEVAAAVSGGAQAVHLGPTILRIETAAIAASALVLMSGQSGNDGA